MEADEGRRCFRDQHMRQRKEEAGGYAMAEPQPPWCAWESVLPPGHHLVDPMLHSISVRQDVAIAEPGTVVRQLVVSCHWKGTEWHTDIDHGH
jgi:hypothetical protein